jgi:hypothetical protein
MLLNAQKQNSPRDAYFPETLSNFNLPAKPLTRQTDLASVCAYSFS